MKEIWKDIYGFEGFYQISNLGRVKSLPRIIKAKNTFMTKEKILKNIDNSKGYYRVELKANGISKKYFVHRLVAEHFINKPLNCNIVNHLDCNPHNNIVDNLEWTTISGNSKYMQKLGRNKRNEKWISRLNKSLRIKMAKKVIGKEINGLKIRIYEALNDVQKDGFQPSCVSNCCNKIRKTHKGYIWEFVN